MFENVKGDGRLISNVEIVFVVLVDDYYYQRLVKFHPPVSERVERGWVKDGQGSDTQRALHTAHTDTRHIKTEESFLRFH